MTPPVQPESEIQKLEAIPSEILAWLKHVAEVLHIIHAATPNAAPLPPAPVAGTVTEATPAEVAAVPAVTLDPKAAVHMTQPEIENLGYVSYLNGLSQADRDAWVHAFLIEASTNIPQGQNVGALVYDPTTGTAVPIEDTAQANLDQLHNLGAQIVTGSTPNQ